jgi:hypothetical protein
MQRAQRRVEESGRAVVMVGAGVRDAVPRIRRVKVAAQGNERRASAAMDRAGG